MAFLVKIDPKRCKSCELCITVCPKKILLLSNQKNALGFNVAACQDEKLCTGCLSCALVCPDAAIEIYTEEKS